MATDSTEILDPTYFRADKTFFIHFSGEDFGGEPLVSFTFPELTDFYSF